MASRSELNKGEILDYPNSRLSRTLNPNRHLRLIIRTGTHGLGMSNLCVDFRRSCRMLNERQKKSAEPNLEARARRPLLSKIERSRVVRGGQLSGGLCDGQWQVPL